MNYSNEITNSRSRRIPATEFASSRNFEADQMKSTIQKITFAMLFGLSLIAFTGAAASAAPPLDDSNVSVTANISRQTVGVADPFKLTIEATAPEGIAVRFPDINQQTIPQVGLFEITNHRDTFDVPTSQGRKYVRELTLETLQTGQASIPQFEIFYKNKNESSQWASVKTETIPVTVQSAIGEVDNPTQFRDIKSVVFLEEPSTAAGISWAMWGFAGLLGGAGVLGFVLVSRFWKRLSPKQRALRSLDEVLCSPSFSRGDTKFVYQQTTQVLRTFIESQFEFPATRQTTEEFLASVHSDHRLDGTLQQRLEGFLKSADMVKFAGLACSPDVLQTAVDSARNFVLQADEQRIAANKKKLPEMEIKSAPVEVLSSRGITPGIASSDSATFNRSSLQKETI